MRSVTTDNVTDVTVGSASAALSSPVSGKSAGSFPEQRLVIEPNVTGDGSLVV